MSDVQSRLPGRVLPIPQWIYDGYFSAQRGEASVVRWGNRTMETLDNIKRSLEPGMADQLERQGINLAVLQG